MILLEKIQIEIDPLVINELSADPIFLERLKPVSRNNIRRFIRCCSSKLNLAKPLVDVACGYRTNKPEAIESHNGIINPLYIAFDHTLNFDNPPKPNASPNLVADAAKIPIANVSVGTALCTEVLEHVFDDKAVIAEIYRVLKSGGRLIMTLSGKDVPKHEKLPYQKDYRRYEVWDIKRVLEEQGFKNLTVEDKYLDGKQINLLLTAQKL